MPALVLVHGGAHAGDSWDLPVDEIRCLAPDLDVLAVDLPGPRAKPGDLRTLTVGECVDSVVADIEDAGFDDIVIVAGLVFLNGLPRMRRRWMLDRLCAEKPRRCPSVAVNAVAAPQHRRDRWCADRHRDGYLP